jgi:ribosomal protein S18 acetylase RimI-like enzyme
MDTQHISKKGKEITIRKAIRTDAKELVDFANLVFDTSDTTLTSSGEFRFTEEKEADFIDQMNLVSDHSIMLVATEKEEIVGMLGFHGSRFRKNKHTGVFGISIHPLMRNEGIGRILTTILLK